MATTQSAEKREGLKKQIANTLLKKEEKTSKNESPRVSIKETNADVHLQQVISRRALKYIYPKDCKTAEKRKTFRAKVRGQIKTLESAIARAKGDARLKAKEELIAYKATNLA